MVDLKQYRRPATQPIYSYLLLHSLQYNVVSAAKQKSSNILLINASQSIMYVTHLFVATTTFCNCKIKINERPFKQFYNLQLILLFYVQQQWTKMCVHLIMARLPLHLQPSPNQSEVYHPQALTYNHKVSTFCFQVNEYAPFTLMHLQLSTLGSNGIQYNSYKPEPRKITINCIFQPLPRVASLKFLFLKMNAFIVVIPEPF